LIQALQRFESELIPEEGTALGDALGMSINQIRDEKNPKKIAILLSDGNNTAGNLDPITSAELAKSFGIKVYTIAVGSLQPSLDPVDESTLRSMAETSNGKFFRATNEQTLAQIFKEIDQLEKTRTLNIRWEEHEDLKGIFLRIAFLFFCLSMLLKISPITNILED
jgi:Ca-activated chloride channel homolog